jgi:hypothetical protein
MVMAARWDALGCAGVDQELRIGVDWRLEGVHGQGQVDRWKKKVFSRSGVERSGMEVGEMKGRRKLEVGGCPRFAARAPRRRRERRRDVVESRITVIIEDIRDKYKEYINLLLL